MNSAFLLRCKRCQQIHRVSMYVGEDIFVEKRQYLFPYTESKGEEDCCSASFFSEADISVLASALRFSHKAFQTAAAMLSGHSAIWEKVCISFSDEDHVSYVVDEEVESLL